jgi:recombination protein RecT
MANVNTQSTREKLQAKAEKAKQGTKATASVPMNQEQRQVQKGDTIAQLIKKMEPEIKRALPEHIKPERLARIALTAAKNNPKLGQCEQLSFIGAVMQAAQLGLEPNTSLGEAYLIPYYNKSAGQFQAQFQIGYKGILTLAHRTGQYHNIYAHEVYQNDEFHYEYGLHKDMKHIPADVPEGKPIYYYAVYHLKNGGYDFVVWSTKKIKAHALKFSQALKNGQQTPWKSDFDSMAKKTVLKDLLKYAPKSVEFAEQIENDDVVFKGIGEEAEIIEMEQVEQPTENGNQWWN